ncbi:MAG: hypothetical protein HY706_15680 [Candidatus Hydrogenedentes bacterium]|nr:hypothetical protein [Candidatus Hydrogenedentota bacterium]
MTHRILAAALLVAAIPTWTWAAVDLSNASIVPNPPEGVVLKAAETLQAELAERSGITLPNARSVPETGVTILIGTVDTVQGVEVPDKPEAYGIVVQGNTVKLAGRDARGAMFAAGRLIRLADYDKGKLTLDLAKPIATAPDVPYRAHQLAYRNTANTYDAWTVDTYEQYIRDLIFFGCNGVELIPSLSKDEKDGPVMTGTMHAMNVKLSSSIASYGIDVWLWSPVMAEPNDDVTTPEGLQQALEKRRAVFADYPVIDHVFVPGGDDGDAPAQSLVPFLKALAPILKTSHPNAKLWVSNQTFTIEENNYFFDYLEKENPDWLTGVVYGPWTSMGLEEMRDRTPKRFLLRLYPDITHTVRCQYPVKNFDPAFANTVGREPIMALPKAHRHIYLRYKDLSNGFGTYSDGIHDDFNKVIWSAYGWDPNADLETLLEEYGKIWWGPALAKDVAAGLTFLEENWKGPILDNSAISKALTLWESISQRCPDFKTNWRAQMYLFRARFDAYVQAKARAESQFEEEALAALGKAPEIGVEKAIAEARAALVKADAPIAPQLRDGIESLGATLLKSIGYQFSVKPPYLARNPERGAMLDWLDQPVNDRPWLEQRFDAVLAMKDEPGRLAALNEILHWTDPGPGGFYDNLGAVGQFSHVVYPRTWEDDPSGAHIPRSDFTLYKADKAAIAQDRTAFEEANAAFKQEKTTGASASTPKPRQELRMSWQSQISSHYGTPLKMHYDGLDSEANYRLKVTYAGRYRPTMTLTLNDTYAVHGPVTQPDPIWPVEYVIPREATKGGTLDLEWNLVTGRGCMVAEVWLIRK